MVFCFGLVWGKNVTVMQLKTLLFSTICLLVAVGLPLGSKSAAQQDTDEVYLAYVYQNSVHTADWQGNPLINTGPEFQIGQSANLFWSRDGESLFIARRDALFQTFAEGGAAVRLPGTYGITVTLDRRGEVFYYMESASPQTTEIPNVVTFPLRELAVVNATGGAGRLVGYIGNYPTGTAQATLSGAALQYARDGGLLGASRPRIFTTYGETLFYSCCFPDAGLWAMNLNTGERYSYSGAETFVLGASEINNTFSRLAGPTVDGNLLVIDLISGGMRNYLVDAGEIERVTWSPDDTKIYMAIRNAPQETLLLNAAITTSVDTRSANISIWRLDLVTGQVRQLATLGDFYGVSSMAATMDYVFVVAVESNQRLVNDLNAGRLAADTSPSDPILTTNYLPGTTLFRITPDGQEAFSILADVWGVVARPRR